MGRQSGVHLDSVTRSLSILNPEFLLLTTVSRLNSFAELIKQFAIQIDGLSVPRGF